MILSLRLWLYGAATLALAGAITVAQAATAVRFTIAEYSSKTGPFYEEAAAAFEKANPDIDIQLEVVPWDVLLQKLTTDIAGNANADIAIIGTRWLIDFVEQGIVEPLDHYITDDFRGRFIDTFLTPSVLKGKTYGLPVAASARAMYYNKELFAKAGIQAPPATWAETVEAARKISALGGDVHGFGLQGKEIETDVYFYYALWSFGGNIIGADGKSGIASDAAIQAAQLYKMMIDEKLTQPGVTANTREDVQNLFKKGQIGMMITAPFLASQIKEQAPKLQYGIIPVPKGTQSATYGVTDSIILFANSKVKAESWKFLDFIFQQEWRSKFDKNEGFLPVTKAVAAEPYFTDSEDLKAFAQVLPHAHFAPTIAGWEEVADATVRAMQRIYLGEADPKTALEAAADEANKVLARK
ncbi:MAG: sugar ABC transporter substrate-binding protein [Gammaproteobacteria bacterium]